MSDILSLFSVLQHLSTTPVRQFSRVVLGVLSMTGQVTMLNISRWTSEGGSYRTGPTLFQHGYPLGDCILGVFSQLSLGSMKVHYILAGDETIVDKIGSIDCMVYRVFSRLGMVQRYRVKRSLLSLVSVKERRCYPMIMRSKSCVGNL